MTDLQNNHVKGRETMGAVLGYEIPPGINAWCQAFREVQSDPPDGHGLVLHASGEKDKAVCACSWESDYLDGHPSPLAMEACLIHLHPIVLPEQAD